MTKEEKLLKNNIKNLIKCVESCLKAIDAEMAKPSTEERGKRIATICNHLEMQKDLVKLNCGIMKIHGR